MDQSCQADHVKLREYTDMLFVEQHRYVEARLTAIERATDLASASMSLRLDAMNEIRAALKDQSATMATRAELSLFIDRTRADIDELKKRGHIAEGKGLFGSVVFLGFLSVAALVISIIKLL